MAHMVFNGDFFRDTVTGIQRHSIELLAALDTLVQPGEVEVLVPCRRPVAVDYDHVSICEAGCDWLDLPGGLRQRLIASWWRNGTFARHGRRKDAISINTNLALKHYVPDVMAIYDCRLDLFPQFQTTKDERRWAQAIIRNQRRSVFRCQLVMTDSESAKADIVDVYGVDPEKVLVVPCGWQHFECVEEDESIIERLGLSDCEFFLALGSRMPHKNIRWVSEAARLNPDRIFVVTGAGGGSASLSFEGEGLANTLFPGYLSDGEVKALMRRCRAFIQPSLYEGFGLPPLEAMSVGADCIVSRAGSLPEVYEDSVWYIEDPLDYAHIDLDEIMSRPKEPNERVLEKYSWEKSAHILLDAIRELAQ